MTLLSFPIASHSALSLTSDTRSRVLITAPAAILMLPRLKSLVRWNQECIADVMNPTTHEPITFSTSEELTLLTELLDTEQARLLVGIRHTFHREFRDELHRRLNLVESLMKRMEKQA